jgi:DNA-binding NarL/FixJ family response regulator
VIRVLIVDDHAIVRRGLVEILARVADMTVVGEASDGSGALKFIRREPPDVILLDIALPDQSGLEVLKQARLLAPDLPVLMLSIYPEEQYAVRALKAGAAGYLAKNSAPDELVAAIRKAVGGGKYVSYTLAEQLVQELSLDKAPAPHENLSDRELQVLIRIGSGKSLNEIADELALSPKTISTYRSRILEKMDMHNNAELVRYVLERNLIA